MYIFFTSLWQHVKRLTATVGRAMVCAAKKTFAFGQRLLYTLSIRLHRRPRGIH